MQFTNFGENKIVDKMRGTEPPYDDNWYIALASAADDGTFTEITGANLARFEVERSLANWAGTQAAGSVLASSGSSHTTSNNIDLDLGTATADLGDATHIGFFDGASGGNCWIWTPLASPITINNGDPVSLLAGSVQLSLGLTGGATSYLANKLIDEIFRGQAYPWPANTYQCLFTVAPTDAGGGTEVAGGAYARAAIASSMAAWSGTQAAGSTSASSGTGGRSSNNAALTFPTPSADWGVVVNEGTKDAASVGNLLFQKNITPKTISNGGSAPSHAPNTLAHTIA